MVMEGGEGGRPCRSQGEGGGVAGCTCHMQRDNRKWFGGVQPNLADNRLLVRDIVTTSPTHEIQTAGRKRITSFQIFLYLSLKTSGVAQYGLSSYFIRSTSHFLAAA